MASKGILFLFFPIFSALFCLSLIAAQALKANENNAAIKRLNTQAESIVNQFDKFSADKEQLIRLLVGFNQNGVNLASSPLNDVNSPTHVSYLFLLDEKIQLIHHDPSISSLSRNNVSTLLKEVESSMSVPFDAPASMVGWEGKKYFSLRVQAIQRPNVIALALLNAEAVCEYLIGDLTGEEFKLNVSYQGQWLSKGAFDFESLHVEKTFRFLGYPLTLFLGYSQSVDSGLMTLRAIGAVLSALSAFCITIFIYRSKKLHRRQSLYQAAADASMDGLIILKPMFTGLHITDLKIIELNHIAKRIFVSSKHEDVIGKTGLQLQDEYGFLSVDFIHNLIDVFRSGKSYAKTIECAAVNGNERWISVQAVKTSAGVAVTTRDITKEKTSEFQLSSSEERYRRLIEGLSEQFIYKLDENGKIVFVSGTITTTLGYSPQEFIENYKSFIIELPSNADEVADALISGKKIKPYIVKYRHKDGSHRLLEFTNVVVTDKDQKLVATEGIAKDVTKEKELQRKVYFQANHDQLTGLLNRYAFEREFSKQRNRDRILNSMSVLCFVDMDQFKVVNDTCGHQAGDQLLRQISALFRQNVGKNDILARLGGDEFGIVFTQTDIEAAKIKVINLLKNVESYRFTWDGKIFDVGASIGVIELNDSILSMGQYIDRADSACYLAKGRGSNRYHIYTPNDDEANFRERELACVSYIKDAFINQRFRLYCQAIVPLNESEQGIHYEVLLRILSEDNTIISPGEFIQVAERFGLMPKIDFWVVENTLNVLASNVKHLQALGKCSINLSGSSLSDDEFMSKLIAALDRSSVPFNKLCFEITETSAVTKLNVATKFIKTLRKKGCVFALDDFGTGMSSFSYLKNLPVDYLKIDGSFVQNVVNDPLDRAMVKSINDIGQTMGKKTIAEFVSDAETKALLKEIGVNYAQGFAIGKPQLLDEVINQSHNDTIELGCE